uniref:Uncharacterized protein n=1 Tax=Aegilops tauschii subsp. strangulata TaxID=200361 RepID=A0A453RWA4_AEGTS
LGPLLCEPSSALSPLRRGTTVFSKLRRFVGSMAAAAAPVSGHLRARCPCSPFRHRRPVPPALPGRTRQHYSNSSDMGIRESGDFRFGFYANFNVQSSKQEWMNESRKMFYLRTTNAVSNNIHNGATPLRAEDLNHEQPSGSTYPSMYNNLRERVPSKSTVNRYANTDLVKCSLTNRFAHAVSTPRSVVNNHNKLSSMPSRSKAEISLHDWSSMEAPLPNFSNTEATSEFDGNANVGYENKHKLFAKKVAPSSPEKISLTNESKSTRKALAGIYDEVLVVDNIDSAENVVRLLTTKYKSFVHACGTEVANIDVKKETPVDHGEVICFSIYSGNLDAHADFGNGKTCIWVDVLDGGRDVLMAFAPFFEDMSIKKVQFCSSLFTVE